MIKFAVKGYFILGDERCFFFFLFWFLDLFKNKNTTMTWLQDTLSLFPQMYGPFLCLYMRHKLYKCALLY